MEEEVPGWFARDALKHSERKEEIFFLSFVWRLENTTLLGKCMSLAVLRANKKEKKRKKA